MTQSQLASLGLHLGHLDIFWNPQSSPESMGVCGRSVVLDLDRGVSSLRRSIMCLTSALLFRPRVLFLGASRQVSKMLYQCFMATLHRSRDQRLGALGALFLLRVSSGLRERLFHRDRRWGGSAGFFGTKRGHTDLAFRRFVASYLFFRTAWARDTSAQEQFESMGIPIPLSAFMLEHFLFTCRPGGSVSNIGILRKSVPEYFFLNSPPDFVFNFDLSENLPALMDCRRLGIPCTSLVDSDLDRRFPMFPVPGGNDSALTSRFFISFFLRLVGMVAESSSESLLFLRRIRLCFLRALGARSRFSDYCLKRHPLVEKGLRRHRLKLKRLLLRVIRRHRISFGALPSRNLGGYWLNNSSSYFRLWGSVYRYSLLRLLGLFRGRLGHRGVRITSSSVGRGSPAMSRRKIWVGARVRLRRLLVGAPGRVGSATLGLASAAKASRPELKRCHVPFGELYRASTRLVRRLSRGRTIRRRKRGMRRGQRQVAERLRHRF